MTRPASSPRRPRRPVVRDVRPAPGPAILRLQRDTPAYQDLVAVLATLALAEAQRRLGLVTPEPSESP